jgi:nitroimidazol reductase NimA-like FMN-containing flavoprotein (pyridoxamine 5'-phosphate oxidase superfamily)
MRRADREVTEFAQIADILSKCEVARVAMIDGGEPYIVALNFAAHIESGRLTLYFHGASAGRKIDILSKNPRVCFQADRPYGVITDKEICKRSYEYESVVGWGAAKLIGDRNEKKAAIDALIARYGFEGTPSYDHAAFLHVKAWKIEVETITAKRRLR